MQCCWSLCFWTSRIRIHHYLDGSGSGSFHHQGKIVRKTLIFTVVWLLYDLFSLKNDLNVPIKSNKQKSLVKKNYLCFRDAHQRSFSYDRSYQERSSFANDHDRHDKFRFNASFKYDDRPRDKHRNRFVIFVFKAYGFSIFTFF